MKKLIMAGLILLGFTLVFSFPNFANWSNDTIVFAAEGDGGTGGSGDLNDEDAEGAGD